MIEAEQVTDKTVNNNSKKEREGREMKNVLKRGIFLILMIMSLVLPAVSPYAGGIDQMPALEPGKNGSLSVTLSYKDKEGESIKIQGVTLTVYRVADLDVVNGGSAVYTLTDEFKNSQVDFTNMSAADSNQAAKELKSFVLANDLSGWTAVTDSKGQAVFTDLSPAMYLVVQTANADTVPAYTEMDPFLVSVPLGEISGSGNRWNYQVDTIPKTEIGRIPETGNILVTKRLTYREEDQLNLMTVEEAFFDVGLFLDPEGTKPYPDDYRKTIHIINGSAGQVEYTGLPQGVYYVFELNADGTVIKDGEQDADMFYTCIVEGNGEQKVTLDPALGIDSGTVAFNNVYDLPDGYYIGAEIEIDKTVLKNGDRVNVDDTFYAGIFTRDGDDFILAEVVELEQNGTVKVEVALGGEDMTEPVEYWIFETDSSGNRIDKASFAYQVSGEGSVKLSLDDTLGSITIVNEINEEEETVTETTEETTTSSAPPESRNPGIGRNAVKTGDETSVTIYLVLGVAAFICGAAVFAAGHRKQNHR